jgi:hypothetical protein
MSDRFNRRDSPENRRDTASLWSRSDKSMQHDDELAMSGANPTQAPHVCKSRAMSGLHAEWPFSHHRYVSQLKHAGITGLWSRPPGYVA